MPTFRGDLLVDVSDREALYNRMDDHSPLFPPEHLTLDVEKAGQVRLPPVVLEGLALVTGDLLAVTRNEISLRLDPYKELLQDLQGSTRANDPQGFLEPFLQQPLVAVDAEGNVAMPPELMTLAPGDRLVLEVVTEGLRHTLYLYRADA